MQGMGRFRAVFTDTVPDAVPPDGFRRMRYPRASVLRRMRLEKTRRRGKAVFGGRIVSVVLGGEKPFKKGDWIPHDARIVFTCRTEDPRGKPRQGAVGSIASNAANAVSGLVGSLFG